MEAWDLLESTCANPSREHFKQIKTHLSKITHVNLTIVEYMQAIKRCTDPLTSMGKPMDHEDVIDKVLHGLNYEQYKLVIDVVNVWDSSISFEELHEKLITRELAITVVPPPTPFPATAYVVQHHQSSRFKGKQQQ